MSDQKVKSMPQSAAPIVLIATNVVGIGIGYAIIVLLARALPVYEFGQYAGAIATLGLVAAVAEGGYGKYGLKIVPVYVANQYTSLLRGYLRFCVWGCFGLSVILCACVLAFESQLREARGESIIYWAVWFLPCMAGQGVAVDILMSLRVAVTATLIGRILIPGTTLFLIATLTYGATISAQKAVICFGMGSLVGLSAALVCCVYRVVPLVKDSLPTTSWKDWTLSGISFMLFAFLIGWIFKAPLVLLYHLPDAAEELALLVPAFETGCLILLMAKATDKYFQPYMSVVIESRDWAAIKSLRDRRQVLMGSGILLYLIIIFLFGTQILQLYGPTFTRAYAAMCIVAIGSSVWTLFSMAPSFLLFVGNRSVLGRILLVHGVSLVVLSIWLFNAFGILGSAIAYALSISSMALTCITCAKRYYQRIQDRLPSEMRP